MATKAKGGLGFGVFGGVEAGEAEKEVGFEGGAVGLWGSWRGWRRLRCTGGRRTGLAEGEEGGDVGGLVGYGGLETLDALLRGGGGDAADVVLEGGELDASRRRRGRSAGRWRSGVDLAGDLPGDGVLDVEEAGEVGGVDEGGREAELVDFEDLELDLDAGILRRCSCR